MKLKLNSLKSTIKLSSARVALSTYVAICNRLAYFHISTYTTLRNFPVGVGSQHNFNDRQLTRRKLGYVFKKKLRFFVSASETASEVAGERRRETSISRLKIHYEKILKEEYQVIACNKGHIDALGHTISMGTLMKN